MRLLEREDLLASLQAKLETATQGEGALVFVEGEAGIGKTSLLKAFSAQQPATLPVRWGACESLQTPRPLGPVYDIAGQGSGKLQAALERDAKVLSVFNVFLELLVAEPSLVLIEDLHWADEATLDLMRFVGRRISRTRSLVVATFRSDELGIAHPLRNMLGDLATIGVPRLTPRALSVEAMRELAGDGVDVIELHRVTGGNPFFVTEVLSSGEKGVPATVRDAVLTRAARLRPSSRAVLDAVAVAGPRVEPWLVTDLLAAESQSVEDCLATGVLCVDHGSFMFRHEIARQTILQAMTPTHSMTLHRLTLQALRSRASSQRDLARLAHHADGAGDAERVLEYAPAAARDAAEKGAHTQAAQQFSRALRHTSPASPLRASLLDDHAEECHLAGMVNDAITSRGSAAELWRSLGNAEREAVSLSRQAHSLVYAGRNAEADSAMRTALALIPPGSETASAVATRRWAAHLRMLDRDLEEAIREGHTALAIARRLEDALAVVHCLNTIGSSEVLLGRVEEGARHLDESRAMAERLRSDFWIALAFGNMGSACGEVYQFELAEQHCRRCIAFSAERDMDSSRLYQLSWLALVHLYRGRWTDAAEAAHAVLADRRAPGIARIMAFIALGRLRARRGDPGAWDALNEAREVAGKTATLQRVAPMQAARAEAAWLEGREEDAAREAAGGIELSIRKRHAWFASELLFWCAQGESSAVRGVSDVPEFCSGNPFSLEREGRWQEAASGWRALGCPFEAARALARGDEAAQREALAVFQSLGARPMVERVRRSLRLAGVRGLPRGPRESTRVRPAGLTSKEVAVLELLAQGLRNKEIGQRLSRSTRTIDHHIAAVLTKLGVATRAEAVSAAYERGIVKARDSR